MVQEVLDMAAVFPEMMVKRSDGKWDAYFRDANDKVHIEILEPDAFEKMTRFSYEHFGHAPPTKVVS